MRIVFITTKLDFINSGASVEELDLKVRAFMELEHQVEVVTLFSQSNTWSQITGNETGIWHHPALVYSANTNEFILSKPSNRIYIPQDARHPHNYELVDVLKIRTICMLFDCLCFVKIWRVAIRKIRQAFSWGHGRGLNSLHPPYCSPPQSPP